MLCNHLLFLILYYTTNHKKEITCRTRQENIYFRSEDIAMFFNIFFNSLGIENSSKYDLPQWMRDEHIENCEGSAAEYYRSSVFSK